MTVELKQKIIEEVKAVGLTTLYFGCWLAVLILIKQLILAEYHIQFHGIANAVIGALILGKTVLILEHVPLGEWTRKQAAWVDVLLRTALYAGGVLAILILEKGFDGRDTYGGFVHSVRTIWQHEDIYHLWTNVIVITSALLFYNALAVVRSHLGEGELLRLFRMPRRI